MAVQAMKSEPKVSDNLVAAETQVESRGLSADVYPPRNLQFHLAIASICLVCLISTIDLVILASALPVISASMHASSTQAYWCGTGLLLAQAVAQPVYCAVQDVAGHKNCMIVAISIFGLASILCATAQNIEWLLAARVLQGVGMGGCNAMVNVLVADLTPITVRGIYLGITQLTAAVGLVAGIVMGAAFSTVSTWRLIFWINIPICVLAGAGIFWGIRHVHAEKGSNAVTEIRGIDFIGLTILAGSLLALLYGITAGGVVYSWKSANIITALLMGLVGLFTFAFFEIRFAKRPMIEMRLFNDRTVALGFFFAWVHGLIDIALAYYLILYFLIGRLHPLLQSSLEITPALVSIPFWAATTGIAMAKTSRFKFFNVAAWVFLSSGVGALASLTSESSLAAAYGFQLLLAIGSGTLYPGRILAVQAPLQSQDRKTDHLGGENNVSVATTLVSIFTSIGNAFGVGLGGTIVQNRWDKLILTSAEAYRIPASSLEHSAEIMLTGKWPHAVILHYQDILCDSLKVLWIFAASLGGVAIVSSFFQADIHLDSDHKDE